MKSIPCKLILNTRNGHICKPIQFSSINKALKHAKETGLAYRIFVDNILVKSGWYST